MAGIRVNWNASPGPNLAGYNIYWGTSPGVYNGVGSPMDAGLPTILEKQISGLTDNTTYYVAMTARNPTGVESAKTMEVAVTTLNSVPGPPTGVVAVAIQ